jgi:hypothetical protein
LRRNLASIAGDDIGGEETRQPGPPPLALVIRIKPVAPVLRRTSTHTLQRRSDLRRSRLSARRHVYRLAGLIHIKCHCEAFAISATKAEQNTSALKPAFNARAFS